MFLLNRTLNCRLLRLRAEGLENLSEEGTFVIAPNHASYLDSFVVGAALDFGAMRGTYWTGAASITLLPVR